MIPQCDSIEALAADPDVKAALSRIPRSGQKLPIEPYGKVRMKEIGPRVVDAENSLSGALANIKRLEHEMQNLRNDFSQLVKKLNIQGVSENELMDAYRNI